MSEEWTAAQCAEAWDIKPRTWHGYVARDQAPKPARHIGRTPVWDAEIVRAYPRPGRGARTDLSTKETSMRIQDLADQVATSLGDHGDDFDVEGIVEEIVREYGRVNIDSVDSDTYWAIVTKHDTTA